MRPKQTARVGHPIQLDRWSLPPPGALGPAPDDERRGAVASRDQTADPRRRGFPDRASALRLDKAVAIGATAIWEDRQYLDL